MLRIIAVLLVIPLMDAVLLAVVADQLLGWQLTVLLVVLTALLGMLLVRAEGRHTLSRIQEKLAAGELPTDELVDGGFLIAAGAFFLTPGLVTDLVGLLLAVPVTRMPIRAAAKRWVIVPYLDAKADGMVTGDIYVGGFPEGDGGVGGARGGPGGPGTGGPGAGGSGGVGGSASAGGSAGPDFDQDEATDIDFEETDDR